jgi:nucleoside-diphosphate-sugar epimerase
MKLLVTGAAGFVGAAVAREAAAQGHEVLATARSAGLPARLADVVGHLRPVGLDLRDTQAVADLLTQERPNIVVHCAWRGLSGQDRFDRSQITDNLDSSCALVDACIAGGVAKFVGIGSQGEYGLLEGKISERDCPEPTSLYGASKLATLHLTRQLCAQNGVGFAWMRLFSTFGPGDNPNWLIPSLIEQMLAGTRPRTSLGKQLWDYLYISDVAKGIVAAALTPDATGIFNLGSGKPVAVKSIVEMIRDQAAPDLELVFGEIPYKADQIWHMEADIARLTAATGWTPEVELGEGIARTVAWHRSRLVDGGRADG